LFNRDGITKGHIAKLQFFVKLFEARTRRAVAEKKKMNLRLIFQKPGSTQNVLQGMRVPLRSRVQDVLLPLKSKAVLQVRICRTRTVKRCIYAIGEKQNFPGGETFFAQQGGAHSL